MVVEAAEFDGFGDARDAVELMLFGVGARALLLLDEPFRGEEAVTEEAAVAEPDDDDVVDDPDVTETEALPLLSFEVVALLVLLLAVVVVVLPAGVT